VQYGYRAEGFGDTGELQFGHDLKLRIISP
jgi:hypothetical protein